MIIDTILFLPPKDILLMAALFAMYIFVVGSLFHFVVSERRYYEWSKQQAAESTQTKNRPATKTIKAGKTAKASRLTRKAKA